MGHALIVVDYQNDFTPPDGALAANKDAGLMIEAAQAAGLDLPLPELIRDRMLAVVDAGHGEEDMSAVFMASCPERS